jgi:hypothetical protein
VHFHTFLSYANTEQPIKKTTEYLDDYVHKCHMSNCRPFTRVRLGSLRWSWACRRKDNGGHTGDDRTPCGRNKNRQIAYIWHSRAMHYVTSQLAQTNLSACSMKRSVPHPSHNKHKFLSTRRKQCSSGEYSVVWTCAHYQLSNRGKQISLSASFSS